jgi:uncharacterized membrane protein
MTLPEDTPTPEDASAREPEDSFLSGEPVLPEGFTSLEEPLSLPPVRRRRRVRRYFVTPDEDERSAVVEKLARRAFPSFEFFLFSLLCGAILGAGYILDSQALLLLGILLAPLMTPWVGMVLGAVTGSWRFFFQTLAALIAASLLIFLTGALAGLAARFWPLLPLFQANMQSHLWWPNFIVLALGAALLVYSFIRSEDKPILPSVMLSYELLLPLSAAGFGLGSGTARIWPDGFLVFLVHLALVTLVGGIILAVLHFKARNVFGSFLTGLVGLACLAALIAFTGLGNLVLGLGSGPAAQNATPALVLPSLTPGVPGTSTPVRPAQSSTPASSPTESPTPSLQPTPVYAIIAASTGGGALVRSEAGTGTPVATLLNGILVEVLPEVQSVGGANWVRIRTTENIEGWVLQTVLAAATPPPSPTPTLTPTR